MHSSNKLDGLGFENLKIFKNLINIDFRLITVLTGTNSSGKSTVINGLRLIKDNYADLKFSDVPSKFELDSIFNKQIEVGEIISRSGNLQNFISFESEKNEFTFSLQKKLRKIDGSAMIDFTIQIRGNESKKIGKLIKLEMKSKATGLVFFSINEVKGIRKNNKSKSASEMFSGEKDHHVTKIDLVSFYFQFINWLNKNRDYYIDVGHIWELVEKFNNNLIEKDELNEASQKLNEKYDTEIRILKDTSKGEYVVSEDPIYYTPDIGGLRIKKLNEIINYVNEGKFYDFSTLWAHDEKHEELFAKMIQKVYGTYDADSLQKLTGDILEFLSQTDWKSSMMEYDQSEDELGLGYLYFKNNEFHKTFAGLSLQDYCIRFKEQLKTNIEIEQSNNLSQSIVESIKDKEHLIRYIAILLGNKSNKPSTAEAYFYNEFIFHNLNLIKDVFQPFINAEFVSADRSNSDRAKSLLDKDDISRLSRKRFSFDDGEREIMDKFLNKWIVEFGIAEKVIFKKIDDSENFNIFLNKSKQDILLADMGFGVSQLLPVILSCFRIKEEDFYLREVRHSKEKIVAVEEPETNLHPALQSKLADFFIDAAEQFNIQFIIETHSEYLIRKLQYLTAKTDSNLQPEHTVIYYFYHPDQVPVGEDQVKKIYISDDGSLTDDFGSGFFDESDKIAISLWNMTKSRKN